MTCKQCRIAMVELKGHLYHGKRKFRCPSCHRVNMKKPKRLAVGKGRGSGRSERWP